MSAHSHTNHSNRHPTRPDSSFKPSFWDELKFSLSATIILPIVGQIISTGRLFNHAHQLRQSSSKEKAFFFLALAVNVAYVAAILVLFSTRTDYTLPDY